MSNHPSPPKPPYTEEQLRGFREEFTRQVQEYRSVPFFQRFYWFLAVMLFVLLLDLVILRWLGWSYPSDLAVPLGGFLASFVFLMWPRHSCPACRGRLAAFAKPEHCPACGNGEPGWRGGWLLADTAARLKAGIEARRKSAGY